MIEYIDTRARWKILSFSFALFILFFSLSTYISSLFVYEWLGIPCGCAVILWAIIPHRLGKKNSPLYLISIIMNAIGTGLAVSAYYIVKGTSMNAPELALISISVVALYAFVNFLISVFGHKKILLVLFALIMAGTLVICVVFWIMNKSFAPSFAFFNIMFFLFFLAVCSLTIDHPERVALRDLSLGAFGSFVVAAMIVIAILSEGDIVDGFDIGDVTKKSKKSANTANTKQAK